MPTRATSGREAGATDRRPGRPSLAKKIDRVREILEETCEQDGQGWNLQESTRRKAYRAGINRALEEISRIGHSRAG